MEFQDRVLKCIDCQQDFTFTAGEQEFYDRKGFREIPKRCKPCRENRKQRRSGGEMEMERGNGNGNGNSSSYGNGNSYGARGAGGGSGGGSGGGGGGGAGGGGGGGGGGRGAGREMFDATCAACGAPARVPFRPAAGRPVYCRDCYANRSTG